MSALQHITLTCFINGKISQENILVDEDGVLKLVDFGLSWMICEATLWKASTQRAGISVRWTSPELLKDEKAPVSMAADVYAFAMIALVCHITFINF